MIGLARGALDHAIAYAKQRKQFGRAIAEFQGVQFELALMATEVEAARLLVYNAARLRDAGTAVYCRGRHGEVLFFRGGREGGFEVDRDSRRRGHHQGLSRGEAVSRRQIGRIYEGTSNIQLLLLPRNYWVNKSVTIGSIMRSIAVFGTMLLSLFP